MIRLENIQGNLLRGYTHPIGLYRFLTITEPEGAREWIARVLPRVTSEAPWAEKPSSTLNLMFSWDGLAALGLPETVLGAFPDDFRQGMAARASVLNDTGSNAPENWEGGFGTGRIHLAAVIFALDEAALAEQVAWIDRQATETGGLTLASEQRADRLVLQGPDGKKHYPEHFGYVDGIGQPSMAHEGNPSPPGDGVPEGHGTWRDLAVGEFVLGYQNEGEEWASPGLPERLWKDGTYVVYRRMRQDVAGFRRYLKEQAVGYPGGEEKIAAKIVGRWRDGTPLALSPDAPDPELAWDDQRNNDFRYADDPDGLKCPLGAHIRRANPRDALPFGASMVLAHRLIRRGIPYGPPLPKGQLEDDGVERGFLFLAYQTNIARQFEFVQSLWLNDGNKFGLGDDIDPLVGQGEGSGKMTIPGSPPFFLKSFPAFVTIRGGEYFLRPSLDGLRYLADAASYPAARIAETPEPEPNPFQHLFDVVVKDISEGVLTFGKSLAGFLKDSSLQHPHLTEAQFKLMRHTKPILVLGGMAVVTRYDDVRRVLEDGKTFPVAYQPVMERLAGPGTLGMGPTPEYEQDTAALREVVRKEDLPRISALAESVSNRLVDALKPGGRLDLVQNLCNAVPCAVLADYFGTPGVNDQLQLTWSYRIFEEIFGNFKDDVSEITPEGLAVANQWCVYLDGLIQQRRADIQAGKPTHDDLLDRLIRQQLRGSGPSLTDIKIRANLMYMTVGFLPQVSKVTILALDELLDRPEQLAGAQQAARDGNLDLVAAYVWEALRFNAETPGLFRKCAVDTVLAQGTDHATKIPAGTLVLAATQSASFDEQAIRDPEAFRLDRPWSNYLYFGSGQHTCMGEYVSRAQVPHIAAALLRLPGLKRAFGPPGRLHWNGIWPERLEVTFHPQQT